MKVTLLPSSVSHGADSNQFLTTFLIDDVVAIDAGSLGFLGPVEAQAKVKDVFVTHTHIDHLASLPIFVENVYDAANGKNCVTIHASEVVLDCLRRDIFNDRVWPDFFRLSRPEAPLLKVEPLHAGRPVRIGALRITPIDVDHLVPTLGLIVEGPGAAVVIAGDTGPTEELWRRARATENLRAVFLEAAFPESLTWLADASRHLTPRMFAAEVHKLAAPGVPILAVHIKPKFMDQIASELAALGLPGAEICRPGKVYEF